MRATQINIDRLTLRNVDPTLKHALQIRASGMTNRRGGEGTSIEHAILAILQKELANEIKVVKILEEQLKELG
jgi:plasmid stability protein